MNLSWASTILSTATLVADSVNAQNIKGSKNEHRGLQNRGRSEQNRGRSDENGGTGSPFSTMYTMTNLPDNGIIVYSRDEESGQLTYEGTESTTGTGGGPVGSNNNADFLNSTGPITVAGKCLLAVNAGSNDISTFRIKAHNRLEFSGKVSSEGTIPVSVAARDGIVYILNAGGNGSIQGYNLNPGTCALSTIGSSIELDQEVGPQNEALPRFTFSAPSQVGFLPDGNLLVLIKVDGGGQNFPVPGEGSLNVYTINPDGTTSADSLEHIQVSGAGAVPFAFDFDDQGRMVLVDARGGGDTGGQVRLYDEDLNEVQSLLTNQQASCWIKYSPSNSCVYASNTPDNSISSFKIEEDLELVEEVAATNTFPLDMELSPDGRYLYHTSCDLFQEAPVMFVYEMSSDCGLVQVQGIAAESPIGCPQGIAMFSGEPGFDHEVVSVA